MTSKASNFSSENCGKNDQAFKISCCLENRICWITSGRVNKRERKRTNERVSKRTNERERKQTKERESKRTKERTREEANERMRERVSERTNERVSNRTNERTNEGALTNLVIYELHDSDVRSGVQFFPASWTARELLKNSDLNVRNKLLIGDW